MDFNFGEKRLILGRIIFVLCLDRKKMKERIIVGEESEVRRLLELGNGDVYFDVINPLGHMLFTFEQDQERLWNVNNMQLFESYKKLFNRERWKSTEQANAFLRQKYKNGVPVIKYAAMRVWSEYLYCFNKDHSADVFLGRASMLCRTFLIYDYYKPWQDEAKDVLDKSIRSQENQLSMWYPNPKQGL